MPYKDPEVARVKGNEYSRRWYARNKVIEAERNREYMLKTKYGTTPEEYEAKLVEQNYVCAICGGLDTRRLAQDHNHDTGAARGLLCARCNTALARLEDEERWVEKAMAYLERWKHE